MPAPYKQQQDVSGLGPDLRAKDSLLESGKRSAQP